MLDVIWQETSIGVISQLFPPGCINTMLTTYELLSYRSGQYTYIKAI